jgi:hypothetical protein
VITRTGHYKEFPVVGCALAAGAVFLLSTMGPDTSQRTVTAYMVLLGVGIGLSMQVLVLAAQNAVPMRDIGAGTSSIAFFRSMGGSIGVAIFGAVFNNGLHDRLDGLDGLSVSVGEGSGFRPEVLDQLAPAERATVIVAFSDSLTTVFLAAVPLLLIAVGIAVLMPHTKLRESTRDHAGEPELAGVL